MTSRRPLQSAASSTGSSNHPEHSVSTPDFTPTDTPRNLESTDLESIDRNEVMDDAVKIDDSKADASAVKEEQKQLQADKDKPEPASASPTKAKKVCKSHSSSKSKQAEKEKEKKKKKKSASKDSDSSSSSSSSGDSSSDDDSDSDDGEARKKKKKKAKKLKEKKAAKKAKSKKSKRQSSSSDDDSDADSDTSSDSSSDSSSDDDEKRRKKRKKAKKQRKEEDGSDDESAVQNDQTAAARQQLEAQLQALMLQQQRTTRLGKKTTRPAGDQGSADKSGKKKQKKASKLSYFRVDQLWSNDTHRWEIKKSSDDNDVDEYGEYIFHVRRKFDWEGKFTDTVVDIKSKKLRDSLKHVMGSCKGVSLAEETPAIDPNVLFLYLEELRMYYKELKGKAKSEKKKKDKKSTLLKASQLKCLVKYLDKDYAETKKTLYPLLEAGTITFDLLWALFKSNEIAYCPTYSSHEHPRAFKIDFATKECSFMKGTWWEIEGKYLEFDGKSFGMGTMEVEVEAFKGPRKITSLACYPLKYHKDPEGIRKTLKERGEKFIQLAGMQYKFCKGLAFYKKKRQVIKVNIDGRIMVDARTFRRIAPNYPISTVKPADPDILEEEVDSDEGDCNCCDSEEEKEVSRPLDDADKVETRMKLVVDKKKRAHIVEVEVDENGNEVKKEDIDQLAGQDGVTKKQDFTEEELVIASPVVLGFAFSEKLWLEFTVSSIFEIEFNEGAFDSLVLPPNQKSIVKALVESHAHSEKKNIDDVIQGKGKGLVAILHGPSGVGKTLTAEGIAELLKRPLYMVSAGELGTHPRDLETELTKILDIAHTWNALLLLDEADVFLEKRTAQDIHRNALVSIFLRLLEYFQGILFLTTNRVEYFDPAFQSRIHLGLKYSELTFKAKRSIWAMFLTKVKEIEGVETAVFSPSDLDKMAKHNLNGRQIKNAVRTAQALAVNEKIPLCMAHVNRTLEVLEAFEQDLKGGTGYEDAMRSYT